jgi:(2Fe-2S) ferredoxin
MCGAGPNLIVYPEGVVCNSVDENRLVDIIKEHVRQRVADD